MAGSNTESGTPVVFASSIEMPVTPPSMKPLDSRKPFSPIPADMTPTAISAALSDSWASRLRATVLGRHSFDRIEVAKRRLGLQQFFEDSVRNRGLGKPSARAPMDFTSVSHHRIDIVGQRRELPPRVLADSASQEADEDRIRRLQRFWTEGFEFHDRRQLRHRADKGRDRISERLFQVCFDGAFQIAGALPGRLEHDVAARDERFGAAKAGSLEQRAQAIHLHDMATDVDGTQERSVLHGVRRNRPTSTPLPR